MRSIAILNQKGGVGKTTTTANLAAAIAAEGNRVLLLDMDPQSHLSLSFGVDPTPERSTYAVLGEASTIEEAMHDAGPNIWLVPSHIDLYAAEVELVSVLGREVILRDALAPVAEKFDYLFIDCPPSLGLLTINSLAAVTEVFIPLQPHFLALQGLGMLLDETIRLVSKRINPALRVTGVIPTLYEGTTRLAGEILDDVEEFFAASRGSDCPWSDAVVLKTRIRRNIKLAEAPSHGMTVFEYAPDCNGAADYRSLAKEVLTPAVTEAAPETPAENHGAPVIQPATIKLPEPQDPHTPESTDVANIA